MEPRDGVAKEEEEGKRRWTSQEEGEDDFKRASFPLRPDSRLNFR